MPQRRGMIAAVVIAGAIAVLAVVFIAGFAWSSASKDTSAASDALDDTITNGEGTEASDVAQLLATTTSAATTTTAIGPRFAADTAAPTTTTVPRPPETVEITGITVEGGRYLVEYVTRGYIEDLPGDHVHFYWDTVYESQAGVGPNEKEWFVWGGPRPFDGYRPTDRPDTANAMCSVVANPDHTIRSGTGNCFDLP